MARQIRGKHIPAGFAAWGEQPLGSLGKFPNPESGFADFSGSAAAGDSGQHLGESACPGSWCASRLTVARGASAGARMRRMQRTHRTSSTEHDLPRRQPLPLLKPSDGPSKRPRRALSALRGGRGFLFVKRQIQLETPQPTRIRMRIEDVPS